MLLGIRGHAETYVSAQAHTEHRADRAGRQDSRGRFLARSESVKTSGPHLVASRTPNHQGIVQPRGITVLPEYDARAEDAGEP